MTYVRASSVFLFIMVVLLSAAGQSIGAVSGIWLTRWTTDPIMNNMSYYNTSEYVNERNMYLGVYGGLGGLQGLQIRTFNFSIPNSPFEK